jgi:CPA1 family monovalent cation:H+ antiporter
MPEPFSPDCEHLEAVEDPSPLGDTCLRCLEEDFEPAEPVALLVCRTCGHVGCSDATEGRHARAHHEETGHPLIRPLDPSLTWTWCYVDDAYVDAD